MSVTSVYPNVSPYVGNPATEMLKRENARREIIVPVAQTEQQAAGQGVISEDKSRNHSQHQALTYEQELKNRGTELRQAVEGRQQDQQGQSQDGSPQGNSQQQHQQGSGEQSAAQQQYQQTNQQSSQEHSNDNSQGRSPKNSAGVSQLSADELDELDWLQSRDDEVRQHEHAHASIGGQFAGSPSYDYKRGPDGAQYAVGGEVPIDVSPVANDPSATIEKMQQVRRAALAPAEPSAADRTIASQAAQQEAQARSELARDATEALQDDAPVTDATDETDAPPRARADFRQLNQAQLMQLRGQVIDQFYQTSTVPAERPLRLTA